MLVDFGMPWKWISNSTNFLIFCSSTWQFFNLHTLTLSSSNLTISKANRSATLFTVFSMHILPYLELPIHPAKLQNLFKSCLFSILLSLKYRSHISCRHPEIKRKGVNHSIKPTKITSPQEKRAKGVNSLQLISLIFRCFLKERDILLSDDASQYFIRLKHCTWNIQWTLTLFFTSFLCFLIKNLFVYVS